MPESNQNMPAVATLSSKSQVVIPKAVRDSLRWEAGHELVLNPKRHGLLILSAPKPETLAGIAKGAQKDNCRDRKDRY
jgi:AbrB family looped-hinge helix DNA binding protein